jgi:cytochrome c oxidase subunit 1
VEAAAVVHPRAVELGLAEPRLSERRIAWLFAGSGVAVFAAMGLAGLAMRLDQGEVIDLSPSWFYRLLTLHGAGMLTGALLTMMGALWFVVRRDVPLGLERMLAAFVAILLGAVAVIVATLIGGFGTGWTFLSPLPYYPAGQWRTWATVVFLTGLLLVGAGFFVFCLDVVTKVTASYGGLQRALGIPFLRGRDDSPPPPPVLAATVVSLEGLLASAAGTTVVVAMIGRTIDSGMQVDALWAKNLIYFFGHSVANLIIYLAAGAIYVLVPRYAGRPWKTTKPIVVGWLFTLLFVTFAYSHHLYMDFVQPGTLQIVSTFASFGASIPVAVVTIYTGMMLVWGSRYRWTLASSLLYLGFAGWAIGGTGAVLDSIIPFNFRFHNTLWVVAHFHTYLLLCVIFWSLAFVAHLLEEAAGRTVGTGRSVLALTGMAVGGYGLVGTWYLSGVLGIPRRYAVEPAGTAGYSLAGSIFAMIFALGFLVLLGELLRLGRAAREHARYEQVERVSSWSGRRYLAREPRSAAARTEEPLPAVPEPAGEALATPLQLGGAVAVAVVCVFAFLPPIVRAAEGSTQYHHLQHAAQFLLGAAVGLLASSLPVVFRHLGRRAADLGIVALVAVPAGAMLVMLPSIYEPLDDRPALHFLYHVGIAALGLVAGLGAGALGRVTGRLGVVLAVGMAVMYAAGAGGT